MSNNYSQTIHGGCWTFQERQLKHNCWICLVNTVGTMKCLSSWNSFLIVSWLSDSVKVIILSYFPQDVCRFLPAFTNSYSCCCLPNTRWRFADSEKNYFIVLDRLATTTKKKNLFRLEMSTGRGLLFNSYSSSFPCTFPHPVFLVYWRGRVLKSLRMCKLCFLRIGISVNYLRFLKPQLHSIEHTP